jgi:hypothetical protein
VAQFWRGGQRLEDQPHRHRNYGADYLRRAGVAFGGLGANTPEDAIYPTTFADADGKPYDSGQKYVLHFDKDQLPPARAFWSLTIV